MFADLEKHFSTELKHSTIFTWQILENTDTCKILLVVNEHVFAAKVKNKDTGFEIIANQVFKHFNLNLENQNKNLSETQLAELSCHAVCWNQVGTFLDFINAKYEEDAVFRFLEENEAGSMVVGIEINGEMFTLGGNSVCEAMIKLSMSFIQRDQEKPHYLAFIAGRHVDEIAEKFEGRCEDEFGGDIADDFKNELGNELENELESKNENLSKSEIWKRAVDGKPAVIQPKNLKNRENHSEITKFPKTAGSTEQNPTPKTISGTLEITKINKKTAKLHENIFEKTQRQPRFYPENCSATL
jgi:hypothetical protein